MGGGGNDGDGESGVLSLLGNNTVLIYVLICFYIFVLFLLFGGMGGGELAITLLYELPRL